MMVARNEWRWLPNACEDWDHARSVTLRSCHHLVEMAAQRLRRLGRHLAEGGVPKGVARVEMAAQRLRRLGLERAARR